MMCSLVGFGVLCVCVCLPKGRKIFKRDKLYTKLSQNSQPSSGKSAEKKSSKKECDPVSEKQNALLTTNNIKRHTYVHVL